MSNRLKYNVYMDYAATHPLSLLTRKYIMSVLDIYGNPSSQYTLGDQSRKLINDTRQIVADFINTKPDNIYFTSGGCASNTLAIKGYVNKHPDTHVFYSPIAHKSILKCMDSTCYPLLVSKTGSVIYFDLDYMLRNDNASHKLVVIDFANSEIGTIQDVREIIDIAHRNNAIVMLDATGSIPTIPLDVEELGVDMVTFSGHKLGSLKGVGVLYKKKNIELEPLIYGSQEQGLFGGTENVIGIASLGYVIQNYHYSDVLTAKITRDAMWSWISTNIPNCYLVGEDINSENRLINNLYICFKGVDGETLMTLLSGENVYVSTGSACNSGISEPSSTLVSIGMNEEDYHSCIRITLDYTHTTEEIMYVCEMIKQFITLLRNE